MNQPFSLSLLNDSPPGLEGYTPPLVDRDYLRRLGALVEPHPDALAGLERGSRAFARRLQEGTLYPRSRLTFADTDPDGELEVHNYTGACPTLTWEVNPVGGCHVGCLYCLVSDGVHERELVAWRNYPDLVERHLERHFQTPHFYYFSPKTEALQEPTLQTGLAHGILRAFLRHYERHPDSLARLFVASKAGPRQLLVEHEGETVLDLFGRMGPRMQFNTSLSILPDPVRRWFEPHAPSLGERLEALGLCRERGIVACSALVQPILTPYATEERVEVFFDQLAAAGVVNFKPELLTVAPENLAVLGPLVGRLDPDGERALYEAYLDPSNADHKKQRDRTAPDRDLSRAVLDRMRRAAHRRGITTSICFWVRHALGISEEDIPVVNRNGFQCLGYQTRLFGEARP